MLVSPIFNTPSTKTKSHEVKLGLQIYAVFLPIEELYKI
jgi:hypothetical protein